MGTVSTAAIAAMVVDMILGFAIPVVLCIVFKKKTGGSLKAFFVGCGVFFVFAYILESLFHNIILGGPGAAIKENIWLYGLYGGFMAGLFEETGRFIAFKTILKKDRDNNNNALMYGAGHGGLEALLIMGLTMINNIIYSIMINSGQAEMLLEQLPEDAKGQMLTVFESLTNIAATTFLLSPVERMLAITFHISASVLVWFAAKNGGKSFLLFPLAIVLHMGIDMIAVIVNNYVSAPIIVELVIAVCVAVTLAIAMLCWKRNKEVNTAGNTATNTAV